LGWNANKVDSLVCFTFLWNWPNAGSAISWMWRNLGACLETYGLEPKLFWVSNYIYKSNGATANVGKRLKLWTVLH